MHAIMSLLKDRLIDRACLRRVKCPKAKHQNPAVTTSINTSRLIATSARVDTLNPAATNVVIAYTVQRAVIFAVFLANRATASER